VRCARARLVNVDDELIAERSGQHFIRGSNDRVGDALVEPTQAGVGNGGGLLDEDGGGDEVGVSAQTADPEILDGAGGLDAVVRLVRDAELAERITLGATHDR